MVVEFVEIRVLGGRSTAVQCTGWGEHVDRREGEEEHNNNKNNRTVKFTGKAAKITLRVQQCGSQ